MIYMPAVPYEYYRDVFNAGAPGAAIGAEQWGRCERSAWHAVNFRRVDVDALRDADGELPGPLRDAICAAAEIMQVKADAPNVGDVVSETNFGTSWRVKEAKSDSEFSWRVMSVVADYLFNTEYWDMFGFRGVYL